MKLCIGLGLSQNRGGASNPIGPTITAPGSIDVSTFKIGTTQTITAGTATATGGGTVTYELRHLSDGEVKSTLAGYAHVAADDTENGTAQWRAVESGGSNDGATSWQTVASGTITYPAPTASGALSDQSFTENTGNQTYDASGDFTGSALVYSLTTAPAGVTINSSTGVVTFDTNSLSVQSGTSIVVTATNSGDSVNSGFSLDITAAATAPDAFIDANWSVATGSGPSELDITVSALPANNGASITNVQYDVDGSGTWLNLPSYAGTGTYTVTMAAASTSYGIRLRAVNSAGNGVAGNTESATSGAGAATAPSAFVGSDWSVAAGSGHKELDITIATLPNNGGSAITDIEYDVDASGSWVSLGTATTGTTTITMAAGNTSYAIRLRAVNAVGNASPGNSESATSAALAITGYSFNGTDTISFSLNGTGTVYWSTTDVSELDAADIENAVAAIDSGNDAVVSGSNNLTWTYPSTSGDKYLNLVAKDAGGYSNVISNQYTFPPSDVTAPILSSATDAASGATASTGSVSTDEGNGTLYWVVTTSATAPSAAQVKLGQDNTGTAATASGSQAVSATGVQNITPSGLTASTAYTTHFMHEDAASNQSTVASASGFTTTAGPITQPPAYADVFAHYDASDAATITDTSGAVDQWNDKKNANNLTATTTARPTTGTVTIGGLNAVDFDGTSDTIATSGATDIGTGAVAYTVAFVVLLRTQASTSGGIFSYGDESAGGGAIAASQLGGTNNNEVTSRFFNGYVESDAAWTTGDVQIAVTSLAAGQNYSNVTWHVDGSSTGVTNNNTNSLNLTSTKNMVLGNLTSAGSDYFNGAIGEIVFYDKVLSQSERETLEGYLAHKWGQEGNLPAGHPYKSSPP